MSNYQDKNISQYAEMFKALSNPNRLKIFMRLVSCCPPGNITDIKSSPNSQGTSFVGDLGQDLGIGASTVSHHIKELRQAGLIRMERQGQKVECWVDPEKLSELQVFFK